MYKHLCTNLFMMILHEGEIFRKWLEVNELTQKEILDKLELKSRNSLYNYFSTERFSADVVKKLLKIGFDVHSKVYNTGAESKVLSDPSQQYHLSNFGGTKLYLEQRVERLEQELAAVLERLKRDQVISNMTNTATEISKLSKDKT